MKRNGFNFGRQNYKCRLCGHKTTHPNSTDELKANIALEPAALERAKKPYCPRCNNSRLTHDGYAGGRQIYYCKECGRRTVNPVFITTEITHIDAETPNMPDIPEPPLDNPDLCGACERTMGNILGDIDATTHERYGYLCAICTALLQKSKVDASRLRKMPITLIAPGVYN